MGTLRLSWAGVNERGEGGFTNFGFLRVPVAVHQTPVEECGQTGVFGDG